MFLRIKLSICSIILSAVFFLPCAAKGAGITLTESLSSELRYESNANLAPGNGTPSSDYSLGITPSISIIEESGRVILKGSYTPTGYIYLKDSARDSVTHHASAGASVALSDRSALDVTDDFSVAKDVREINPLAIQVGRANVVGNAVTVSLSHKLTQRTTVGLSLGDSIIATSNGLGYSLSRSDSASATIGFVATENTSFNASYSYSLLLVHPLTGPKSSTDVHSVQLGAVHRFPYSLEVSFFGGAAYIPGISNQYTVLAGASVKKAFQRSSLSFQYSRGIINTTALSTFVNVSEQYSASWDYAVTNEIGAGVSGNYGTNKSKSSSEVDIRSYGIDASVHWGLYPWMSLGAGGGAFKQISKDKIGQDFRGYSAFVSTTLTTSERR